MFSNNFMDIYGLLSARIIAKKPHSNNGFELILSNSFVCFSTTLVVSESFVWKEDEAATHNVFLLFSLSPFIVSYHRPILVRKTRSFPDRETERQQQSTFPLGQGTAS